MASNPFYSVIIPTYNRAEFIAKAVQSVLDQTFKDFELIIVNDASTDLTMEVLERFKSDSRVRIFTNKTNQERSVSRNIGISKSNGSIITFLDDDDYFLPNRLEKVFNYIEGKEGPVFLFTGKKIVISHKDEEIEVCYPELENKIWDPFNTIIHPKYSFGTPQVFFNSFLLKKENFNPKHSIGEDLELFLRISLKVLPTYICSPTVATVSHGENSIGLVNNPGPKKLKWLFDIKNNEIFKGKIKKKTLNKLEAGYYFNMFSYQNHFQGNWNGETLKYSIRSLYLDPKRQTKTKLVCILYSLPGGLFCRGLYYNFKGLLKRLKC